MCITPRERGAGKREKQLLTLALIVFNSQHPTNVAWFFSFALCLLVAWLIIYIVTSKQVIRKQFYVRWSCLCPLIIIIFLIVLYTAKPSFSKYFVYIKFNDWEQYSSVALWVTALQQVLLSTGVGTGIIVTFASYNDFNTNRIRGDAYALNIVAFIVNVFMGILFVEVAGTLDFNTNSNKARVLPRELKLKEKPWLRLQTDLTVPRTPAELQLLYFNMMNFLDTPQAWMCFINLLFVITGTVSVQLAMEVLLTTLRDNVTHWKNRFLHAISCGSLFLISLVICTDTVKCC